jgi:hypothetical protein
MRRSFTCAVVLIALLAAGDPALAARAPGTSPSAFSWLPTRFKEKLASATSGASEAKPRVREAVDATPKPDDSPRLDRRVLAENRLNPWLQPTTFLRVALLMCALNPSSRRSRDNPRFLFVFASEARD